MSFRAGSKRPQIKSTGKIRNESSETKETSWVEDNIIPKKQIRLNASLRNKKRLKSKWMTMKHLKHKIRFIRVPDTSNQRCCQLVVFAFAYNAKSFTIATLIFLLFFCLAAVFERTAKSFFGNDLRFNTKEARDQDLTHSLHTLKNVPVKIVPIICNIRGTWKGLFTVTSFDSIQKSTRNSQKLRNTLASKWQRIQESKQTEIKLIRKKSWRKRKDAQKKILIGGPCGAIKKTAAEEHVTSENIPTFCWSMIKMKYYQ